MSVKSSSARSAKITHLPSRNPHPSPAGTSPAHHVGGNPPTTHFRNPWPSFKVEGLWTIFNARFIRTNEKNFVPVPANREGLVKVRKPDWGLSAPDKLRATWLGHASFLVELPVSRSDDDASRGVRLLFDPVFSERTSPFQWLGPKRYTPTPCGVGELPEIDAVVISHNHYDHLDVFTIKEVCRTQKRVPKFFCGLGVGDFFTSLGCGITAADVVELDWWDAVRLDVEAVGSVELVCTPAQHVSARTPFDKNKTLWCSWVAHEIVDGLESHEHEGDGQPKRFYFAGDTGYRNVSSARPTPEEERDAPTCPAFKEIGNVYGPFDLALLPIGLYSPRDFMSSMHCAPEDSACVHADVKSRKSIGMHYGTVRGGISAQYEDVLEPPARWKKACEAKGYRWDEETGLCDVGETVFA